MKQLSLILSFIFLSFGFNHVLDESKIIELNGIKYAPIISDHNQSEEVKVVQEFLDCMIKGGYGFPCTDYFLSKALVTWDEYLIKYSPYANQTEEECQSSVNMSCIEANWKIYTKVYIKGEYFDIEKVGDEPMFIDKDFYYDFYSKVEFYEFEIIDIEVEKNDIEASLHSINRYGVKNKMSLTMKNGSQGWKVIYFLDN